MPLASRQILLLAEFDQQWNLAQLTIFAADRLNLSLDNLAPRGSLKDRALELINHT